MEHNYLKISDIGKVITGKTPSTEDASNFDGKYPFITPSDIKTYSEKYLLDTERTLSDLGADTLKGNILPKNTICFVCIGSTIGKMCMTNCESFTNQQINSLIPFPEYDSSFIFYILRYVKSYFQSIGGGTGSGKGIVNKTVFSKTKLDIPFNLETQKIIAEILSSYDSLIELNTKRIKTLEQMTENLYKEWFVRFRFPGHENAEFENGIPKGWEVKRLEDFCYVTDGTHDTPSPTSDGFPLITGKHISDGDINFDEAYLISEEDHKKISKRSGLASGDILFSNIGTVGKCCIVNYDREFSVKNVIIFKLSKMYKSLFLYHALNSSSMQELFQAQTNGASQQFVGLTFMRRFKLLIPPESILQCFYNKISDTYTLETSLKRLNKNLIKQRDLLLPRLMSGKLEV